MGMLDRWFKGRTPRVGLPAYQAVIERARMPHWYLSGGVADTIEGRFDMIAAVLAMVMLRLEQAGEGDAAVLTASLAECFVDDMDGQLRQIGVGDLMVGKHIGKMMAMLGGRLGAYRDALEQGTAAMDAALIRNLYLGQAPDLEAVAHSRDSLIAFHTALRGLRVDQIRAGELP